MEIVSTMGSGSLGRELDLEVVVSELENHFGDLPDANFHSPSMVTIRLEEDGPACTLYRTGTIQIRGSKTEELLHIASHRLRDSLDQIGLDTTDYEFEQVTSVLMEDLDRQVNLEVLAIALGLENTEYEPEQFPGLVYRPPEFELTLLVFASGKVIIGGTMDREHAADAISHLREGLFRIPTT